MYQSVACAQQEAPRAGDAIFGFPEYSLEEISKHKTVETGIWVTYRDGVYDITQFAQQHPGGSEKILLAAGKPIDPFWEVFAQHNTEQVHEILEELRIGNITPEDRAKIPSTAKKGPYANDPVRSPILKVNTNEPFNAESPVVLLTESYLTPNELFFVRNHLPVPVIEAESFALAVTVEGSPPVKLTLEDLQTKFTQHTISATIQCAGNRREDMNSIKEVKGLRWTGGAIGNAEWKGVLLRDVLMYAGLNNDSNIEHVHLEGLDHNPLTGECYGASIPIEKALDPRGDCLLAYEMNGMVLPRDHGFPLRAIVPGTVGARNVKWLSRIATSREEYGGFWQQRDYKGFSPSVNWDNVDFSKSPAIQELPVQSLICSPRDGSDLQSDDEVSLKGIAWSGGGRAIVRVDVSVDGGKTWHVADLVEGAEQRRGKAWSWVVWETSIPLPEGQKGPIELCCKAVDLSYNVQPDTVEPIWNLRGCLSNAWHRVHVNVPDNQ